MDYARTLMMEKSVSKKYWREVVSIVVYNLNRVQIKKERSHTTCKEELEDNNTFIYMDDDSQRTPNEQENQATISQQTGNDKV